MGYRLRPAAEADLRAIARHIARDNPRAALRWLDGIEERLIRLGEMPGIGAPRPDIRPELRLLPAGAWLVLYRQVGEDAEIVRILHSARQWQKLIG